MLAENLKTKTTTLALAVMGAVIGFDKRADQDQGATQLDLHALETTLRNINITKYVLMVAMAIWIYDFMLTFDDEVELFWRKKDSILIKTLYIVVSLRPLPYIWNRAHSISIFILRTDIYRSLDL